ncbi:MAG: hybrid sensor histidine kinase/response regulator [Minisyncoccia bacterium]|uniref:hybrid sensor histidine kinase/response regulator n=1 Tax=Roseiflexus castenholzii TaxID=120962 RepID=UPI003C7A8D21
MWYNLIVRDPPIDAEAMRDAPEQRCAAPERLDIERRGLHPQPPESLDVLVGGFVHDVNNLLTAIMGHLDLAARTLPPTSPAFQHIRKAMLATRHAAGLTRRRLSDAGQGTERCIDVDVTQIVTDVVEMLRESVGARGRLDVHLDPALPAVQADPAHIQQVVLNLIWNAAEALPATGGTISVRTCMRFCDEALLAANRTNERLSPGEYLALEVADTGCGMDEATQRRMFDPFFTTKAMGTGLGMASVRRIVGHHHGGIVVDSAPGCGTTVTVLFPPSSPGREREPVTPDGSTAPDPITVLVADDDADVREMTARLLVRLNHRVMTVATGAEAVQTLRANAADVACVLLDAGLADMSAPATLQALRAIAPHVAVVVVSGGAQSEVLARFAEATIEGYVQKPYLMTELDAAIRCAVQRARMATAPTMRFAAEPSPNGRETSTEDFGGGRGGRALGTSVGP